ncbi:MAG: ABC transporter ATP-binding protein [Pseudomonadota bacterium]
MTRLVAKGLALRRGSRDILRDIGFSAQGGEFIAVVGPNGAGKSTLLAALAGLLQPDAGAVLLDDAPLAALKPRELARRRAWLPQNARCEWPLRVERMVALGLAPRLQGFGDVSVEDQARLDAVLADCDLAAQRDQIVTTLSGGELARAMLARALVADPELLIVDEPLAGLDPAHAWDAARRLRALATEQGRLVIASIHDINIALRRATRVLALRDGRLLADGTPATVLDAVLLQQLFGVVAEVRGTAGGGYVDFAC